MLKHQYSPDANSWLTGKHPDAGKDWRQKKWQRMRRLDGITDALDMNLGNFGRWWGTGKSDMLQFMGSWRVGHYLKTKQTARNLQCYSSLWRRQWQPTPVFLPGEICGQRSLAGYSPWGCKESDTTKQLTHVLASVFIILYHGLNCISAEFIYWSPKQWDYIWKYDL